MAVPAVPGRPSAARLWLKRGIIIAIVAAIYAWAFTSIDVIWERVPYGLQTMVQLVTDRMFPPRWGHWSEMSYRLYETLRIAIVAASFGALFALPIALLTARNIARSNWVYQPARFLLNLVRTIPDMVLAAIAVGVIGLGALPGIIALTIFSTTLIAKLLSESIEAIDSGPLEALSAVGASSLQSIRYAVMPQVLPAYASYSLYCLEINVRSSFVLGLVGAGGIGMQMQTDMTLLRYRDVALVVLVTFVAVMLIDWVSTRIRERLV